MIKFISHNYYSINKILGQDILSIKVDIFNSPNSFCEGTYILDILCNFCFFDAFHFGVL